jgi:hypothetical protein
MRKYFLVGAVTVAMAAGAFAATLHVPFFLDNAGTVWSSFGAPSGPGAAGFIAVKNTTGSALVVTLTYTDKDGTNRTPAVNTFSLPANTGMSWRPLRTDTTQESAAEQAIPGKTGTSGTGSAKATWTGGANDIVGRYQEINSNGEQFAYTLPQGD